MSAAATPIFFFTRTLFTYPRRSPAIPNAGRLVVSGVSRRGLPVEHLPDEVLLSGLASRDAELSVAFVRRHQAKMYGIAMAVTGERELSEDVTQQAFERACRHAQVYDPRRGSVGSWLATITRNLAIDATRGRRPAPVDPADLAALVHTMSVGPETATLASEDASALRRAMAALPTEQARSLAMAGIYGMTAREIAIAEGIPLGTAKTRIRTAMGRLRVALAPARGDGD